MADLTVSIVNYNAGDFLLKCLESVFKNADQISLRVVVIDNNSTDSSIELAKKKFPKVEYILNQENLGFGRAHNQVLEKLNTKYVLILNPDTTFEKGVFKELINFMDNHEEVGALSPKVVLEDNSLDWATHRGFPTPLASLLYFLGSDSLYHLSNRSLNKVHEVDAISGAFFLTRKDILRKVGFFDEDYFMYAEDIDLCFRIKQAGFKIIYLPEVKVIHHKGVSSGLKKHSQDVTTATLETRKRSLDAFYQTMKIFYEKHYQRSYPFLINWVIYFGINLKWWLSKRKLVV